MFFSWFFSLIVLKASSNRESASEKEQVQRMEMEPNLGRVWIPSLGISFPAVSSGSDAHPTPPSHRAPPPNDFKQSKYFPDFQEEKPLRNQYQHTNKKLCASQFTCPQWLGLGFN